MAKNFFNVLHLSKKTGRSRARLGEIKTSHGIIKTPAFVPVATKGSLKSLTPSLIDNLKIQTAFVNTYHLVTHPGVEIIAKAGGIHKYANFKIPLMSDSGGFQVFSLARKPKNKSEARNSKFETNFNNQNSNVQKRFKNSNLENLKIVSDFDIRILDLEEKQPFLVKISDNGVKFRSVFDGKMIEFTPEKSMEYQRMIGADLNMAFDECIPYGSNYEYSKKATERTHRWLERCINYKRKYQIQNFKSQINSKLQILNPKRLKFRDSNLFGASNLEFETFLYGIIQGGVFEDLRKKSAEFVVSQDVDGVAIGGVSVGETKAEMRDQVKWVADYLPKDKPVHLLGVGQIDDIIDLVKYGIDTFDCVEPTRKARMGTLYQISDYQLLITNYSSKIFKEIDIHRGSYKDNLTPVDANCVCYVCQNFTKSYLHHLFKQKELLGYTLATYHNLSVMEKLMESIREGVANDLL